MFGAQSKHHVLRSPTTQILHNNRLSSMPNRGRFRHLDINERLPTGENRGLTPLHCAVLHASSSVVCALIIQAGAKLNVTVGFEGMDRPPSTPAYWRGATPLHLATEKGFHPTVKDLCRLGATVDAVDARSRTRSADTLVHGRPPVGTGPRPACRPGV